MTGLRADIEAWNPRGGVMVTVVAAAGSTPRGCGTYMIVDRDGKLAQGTIGGGALEFEAISQARTMLEEAKSAFLQDIPLGPDLGQCCGGRVTLLFERLPIMVESNQSIENPVITMDLTPPFKRWFEDSARLSAVGCMDFGAGGRIARRDGRKLLVQEVGQPRQPLAVFGAGHVGRALVRALSPLPVALRWIDDRAELLDPEVAGSARIVLTAAPVDQIDALPPGCFVLIMTHSHGLDFDLLRRALGRADLGYVGLIGSATKRARFIKRLKGYGLDEAAIGRMTCPIGLPEVSGKDPAVIAASVAVDLLVRIERNTARRNAAATLRVAS